MRDLIREKTLEIKDEVVEFRRKIHANPEIGHEEVETSKSIIEELKKLPLDEIRTNVGGHGVVGILKGKGAGKLF